MKPGKRDVAIKIKISGRQLEELKEHAWQMCEAFGLDTKITKYKGTRAISLYSWDLDCIFAMLDMTLNDVEVYPDKQDIGYLALHDLSDDLHQAYENTYRKRK